MICSFVIYMIGVIAFVRVRRVERIRITPKWLEQEAAVDLAALRFIASSPKISRELRVSPPKGTFRFSQVLASSLAEVDRSGQLMPDQPPVQRQRKRPAAPAPDGKSGDPESATDSSGSGVRVQLFPLPSVTPESVDPLTVSVGENTLPGSKGEERV